MSDPKPAKLEPEGGVPRHQAPRGARQGLLSHPQDVHCVLFHLLTLLAYGCAFWIYLNPEKAGLDGPYEMAAFVMMAALMLGWSAGIDVGVNYHNHAHRKVFRSRWLSLWFGRLWTFSGGWPAFFWKFSHVNVHHAKTLEPEDWTLPKKGADGKFENYHYYSWAHWPWRYAAHLWQEFNAFPQLRKKALRELAIFLALWSIPFFIDPLMALLLWVMPHFFANVFFMAPGMYVQHVGCVPRSATRPFNHSNTFLSGFFNLTMFNIGYHNEHHDYPGVHWTELPELHRRLKAGLIGAGVRVMAPGYYQASWVYGMALDREKADRRFDGLQHPDYPRPPAEPGRVPSLDATATRPGKAPATETG